MKKILSILTILLIIGTSIFATGELTSYFKVKFLGINPRVNPKLLTDDEALDASNITLDESGAFKDRETFGQYNSSSGALGSNLITGLFKYYKTSGKYFVACAGSKICSGSGGTWTDITQSGLNPTPETYWSAITFNNELYLFNPTVAMQNWAGTGLTTTPAGVPTTNCYYGAIHKNRAWAARSDTSPYRLYFSTLNNAEDWTTTGGYIDLPDVSQTITGLASWGGYLFVFTEMNIYRILGSTPNDFSMQKTNSQVGAIAPRTIKISDIGIIFLARTGVFAFDGNSSNKLSDKVEPLIKDISTTNIQNSCGTYDTSGKYWLSYTYRTSSYNDKILIYDTTLKEWYPYDNLNINYFEVANGGTDKGEIYGGSSTRNGIVWVLQSVGGSESIVHSTKTEFDQGVTFNTVTTTYPSIILDTYYGNGKDGNWTIATSKNINTDTNGYLGRTAADGVNYAVSTSSVTAGTYTISMPDTTGLSSGDEVMIINFQAPSSGNYGKWEIKRLREVSSNRSISFVEPLKNTYDGTTDKIMIQRIPNYNNVTLNNGGTLTCSAWDGTNYGIVAFKCYGTLSVNSGGSIDVSNTGYRGGAQCAVAPGTQANQGESYTGTGSASTSANNGGGGGGHNGSGPANIQAAGGGAGYGTNGTAGTGEPNRAAGGDGGVAYAYENLIRLCPGSGGGGGSGQAGGIGGGVLYIASPTVTVAGTIKSNGQQQAGNGGSGSGGSIYIKARNSALGTSLITATGGAGYTNAGGAAGKGRIVVNHTNITGTSDPTYFSGIEATDISGIGEYILDGTFHSQNIQINASGAANLDTISWYGTIPSYTKISFQTRTGVTNDSVYYNGWQYWSSNSSVTFNTVTDATAIFTSSDASKLKVQKPSSAQSRNVLYYEDEDVVSTNCGQFQVFGSTSVGVYADAYVPITNLSEYNWISGWFKSPATGNSVQLYIGEDANLLNVITFNTVTPNVWQKFNWYIGGIADASLNSVKYIQLRNLGDVAGYLYIADIGAFNYYDTSGENLDSSPNDFIQYRGIFSSNYIHTTPELYQISLSYLVPSGSTESTLASSYKTKWLDFGSPQVNKQFLDFTADIYTDENSSLGTFYFDYDIDNGAKTGTITIPSSNTVTNNTVKIRKYFPASTYGNTMKLSYRNSDAKDSKHTIRAVEIRSRPEPIH